jgi:hypothetical protein
MTQQGSPTVKRVCAWCSQTICEGEEPVSHGICSACRAIYFPKPPKATRVVMTRLLLAGLLGMALAAWPSLALAACSTSTIMIGGVFTTCTTCCVGSHCTTTCI